MTASDGLAAAAAAFVISLAVTPLAARLARRVGLLDRPGPLKPQTRPAPYLGGTGVAAGVAFAAAIVRPWLLVPLAMALCLGTADDVAPLRPAVRLAGEVATGVVLAAVLPTRFGGVTGYLLVAVTAVLLANAWNLLDGLDGLCGGVTVVAAVGFAFLLSGDGRVIALALAGAASAFLVFNRPPASVYLGDGGAYLIGLTMAALLAWAWAPGVGRSTDVGGLVVIVLPVAEVALAVVRRVRARRGLLTGDREHPYDVLVRSGWSVTKTTVAYVLVECVLIGLAVAAAHLRPSLAWAVAALAALGVFIAGIEVGLRASGAAKSARGLSS